MSDEPRTDYWVPQVKKPEEPRFRDCFGTPIEVGDEVAYIQPNGRAPGGSLRYVPGVKVVRLTEKMIEIARPSLWGKQDVILKELKTANKLVVKTT